MFQFKQNFKSLLDLLIILPTEQNCIDYLEKVIWNGRLVSPLTEVSQTAFEQNLRTLANTSPLKLNDLQRRTKKRKRRSERTKLAKRYFSVKCI